MFFSGRSRVREFCFGRTFDRTVVVLGSAEFCWWLSCRHYQESLPAEGVSRTRGPTIPLEQMFSDYVDTRGLSNCKFWIVSLYVLNNGKLFFKEKPTPIGCFYITVYLHCFQ